MMIDNRWNGSDGVENLYSWAPNISQWWITGFVPDDYETAANEMGAIGTIDLSNHHDAYDSLKESGDIRGSYGMIFDDEDYTVWIIWWG